ncbi:hypothetical protein FN846DRAFT_908260 [Sphaerosporella brunnea]|uniref:Uncharacterized protein n=1 Tax=Sphaerosporella brunnea TaxID=1250544 RepID=A0A5J5ETB6_9PEZI|nr:hypothetical protein FN846DRAFT_908260 [Sphaerosporella brunnea]
MIPVEVFPASDLPRMLQMDVKTGRRKKVPVEELAACPLKKLIQWECEPNGDQVRCWPVKRFFRICKQVTVEVTALEKV